MKKIMKLTLKYAMILSYDKMGGVMVYTHEQVKNKFGIVYFVNILNNYRLEEHFKTDYIPFDTYSTPEIAKKSFIENSRNDEKLWELQEIVNKYESQSFLKKLLSRKTSEFNIYSSSKKEGYKRANNIRRKIELLESQDLLKLNPKETYKIQYPELSIGDKVYIMVSEQNFLEEGIYEGELISTRYALYDSNNVCFTGILKLTGYKDKELLISVDSYGNLRDGYMNHKVYLNKENAEKDFKNNMEKRVEYYKEKLEKGCA